MTVRTCKHCTGSFVVTNGNQHFCCPECREAYKLANPPEWRPRSRKKAPSDADDKEQDRQDAISEIRYVIRQYFDMGTSGPCVSLRGQPHYRDLVSMYQRRAAA